jgi:hypothetical protein
MQSPFRLCLGSHDGRVTGQMLDILLFDCLYYMVDCGRCEFRISALL